MYYVSLKVLCENLLYSEPNGLPVLIILTSFKVPAVILLTIPLKYLLIAKQPISF